MKNSEMSNDKIAILIPCYNEGITIKKVIFDFKKVIPDSTVYVYDNNSTDNTAQSAREAGAVVRIEKFQGKGNVVRRMFSEIEADIYVLVDGDATYEATSANQMIEKLKFENLDMVVGCRKEKSSTAYPAGHQWGNKIFTKTVAKIFGCAFNDIFSGYRVFSRRFVKNFPATSKGFEIETELTVYSLQMRLRTGEIETPYYSRPDGSVSKLNTFKDGWRIAKTIINLIISERPLLLFGSLSLLSLFCSVIFFIPILSIYLQTGLVPRFPTLIICTSLFIFSVVTILFGIVLNRISQLSSEIKRLFYIKNNY